MVANITIKPVRNSSVRARRTLRKLSRKIQNPTQANRRVSIWLLRWVNENFKTQGAKVGRWKPFKLGGRRLPDGSIDTSAKLLQDTGRLRASFRPFATREAAGVGSSLSYSIEHELGLPKKNLPARRMLPLPQDKEVEQGIIKIYNHYIRTAMR